MRGGVHLVSALAVLGALAAPAGAGHRPDSRGPYRHLTVESNKLCSDVTRRRLTLGRGDQSALLVTQTRLSVHSIAWTYHFLCNFVVDTGIGFHTTGLFAVVQSVNLRYNKQLDECIDYVQFRSRQGVTSPKICGRRSVADEDPILNFVDKHGKINVTIFVALEPLEPDQTTDFVIVFTAFQECRLNYSKCADRNDYCIHHAYFGDGRINCPFPGCVDEGGCDAADLHASDECVTDECSQQPSTSAKVTIGTVTTLVLSFALFTTCLWICRKHKKLCWSDDCTNPNGAGASAPPHQSRVMELQSRPEGEAAPSEPQAAEPDKDLPPSYDSLFPAR